MTSPVRRRKNVFLSCSLPHDCGGSLVHQGLAEELAGSGLQVVRPESLAPLSEGWFENQHRCLEEVALDPQAAAVVVLDEGGTRNFECFRRFADLQIPIVFLGQEPSEPVQKLPIDFVGVNDFMSARRVVSHLIGMGHHSILHVTSEDTGKSVRERKSGYQAAVARGKLAVREDRVITHENDSLGRIQFSSALLQSLLQVPNPPTAVFGVHDWAALNVLMTAHGMGIRMPKPFAVAGFDGISKFKPGRPLLTTAEQPFEEMGRQAAVMLRDRMSNLTIPANRYVYLDAPLKVLGSTSTEFNDSPAEIFLHDPFWRSQFVLHQIRNQPEYAWSLEELSASAGISTRTLLDDFSRHVGMPPMHWLHEERLARVHAELRHPGLNASVSQVAYGWGVNHLGRFARQYRERYGESPSTTLNSAIEQTVSTIAAP